MIPDVAAQRAALRAVLAPVGPRVFTAAPIGTMPAQFILIGMPSWKPPTDALCAHRIEWAVMVCQSRSGTNDEITALALEGLWPSVLSVLDAAVESDAFGPVCLTASIDGAEFGPVTIGGQEFPAQIITLTMQGA